MTTENAVNHEESSGEFVRQVMTFRGLERFYIGEDMWPEAETCRETAWAYQEALTTRMLLSETFYMEEGPYYARVFWLPQSERFMAGVERLDEII